MQEGKTSSDMYRYWGRVARHSVLVDKEAVVRAKIRRRGKTS
jgi:hypothetical protein